MRHEHIREKGHVFCRVKDDIRFLFNNKIRIILRSQDRSLVRMYVCGVCVCVLPKTDSESVKTNIHTVIIIVVTCR